MLLRNAHLAIVERQKLLEYVLNAAHPDNGGKALFFESLGFTTENAELLADAFHAIAQTGTSWRWWSRPTARNMLSMDEYGRTLRRAATGWYVPFGSSIGARKRLGWSQPILEGSESSS